VKPNGNARSHISGNHDEHSDPIVMNELIRTFTGDDYSISAKDTSQYKDGKTEGTKNIPFNDCVKISVYQKLIDNNYLLALDRMKVFIDKHFDLQTSEWFVGAVLEVIQKDDSISDSQKFYTMANGKAITKEQLLKNKSFELEPFLVGILFFILSERRGENKKGVATLNILGKKENRKPRVFSSDIGQMTAKKITVSGWVKDGSSDSAQNKKASSDESEKVDIIEPQKHDERSRANQTVINHQTNVVQNGDHNINLTNNGTINMNL
jgi:hypothetical protein